MWVEIILLCILFLIYAVIRDMKPRGMPPGPPEIPFFGNGLVETPERAEELDAQYGKIYTVRLGNTRVVVVHDLKISKELASNPIFQNRPNFFKLAALEPGLDGILSDNGIRWVHSRKFLLKNQRHMGSGKTWMESVILSEVQELVKHLKSLGESPSMYPRHLRVTIFNILWQLLAGSRSDARATTDEMLKLLDDFIATKQDSLLGTNGDMFFPILKYIPDFKGMFLGAPTHAKFMEQNKRLFSKVIQEHEDKLDENNPVDMVDNFLVDGIRWKEDSSKEEEYNYFIRENLLCFISDMFQVGIESVITFHKWVIYLMAKYPEAARRCQQQIDENVGRDQTITLDDKLKLPQVEAFINEVHRYVSLVPMNSYKSPSEDTTILGYHIPKGTAVSIYIHGIHHDPNLFENPNEFNPQRFITSAGTYDEQKAKVLTFGLGKRSCAGEIIARVETFLITAALLQNFNIEGPEEMDDKGHWEWFPIRAPSDYSLTYRTRQG